VRHLGPPPLDPGSFVSCSFLPVHERFLGKIVWYPLFPVPVSIPRQRRVFLLLSDPRGIFTDQGFENSQLGLDFCGSDGEGGDFRVALSVENAICPLSFFEIFFFRVPHQSRVSFARTQPVNTGRRRVLPLGSWYGASPSFPDRVLSDQ